MLDVGQGSEYVSDKWPCYIKANRGIFRIYVSACRRLEACVYEIAVLEIEVNCQGNACVQHVFIMFRSSRPDAFCKNLFLDISENSH